MSVFNTRDKVMSISRAEFDMSLGKFATGATLDAEGIVRLPAGAGIATIRFSPLGPLTIGTALIRLPRARVTLSFDGASVADEAQFMRRFEIAFQRGGG